MRWARNDSSLNHLNEAKANEHRRPGRVRTDGTLSCTLGPVLDISDSGLRLCVSAGSHLVSGAKVLLSLKGPDGTLVVPGEVCWVRKKGFFARHVGLKFVDDSAAFKARLRKFVLPCMDMRTISADNIEPTRKSA